MLLRLLQGQTLGTVAILLHERGTLTVIGFCFWSGQTLEAVGLPGVKIKDLYLPLFLHSTKINK